MMKRVCSICKRTYTALERYCSKCGIELIEESKLVTPGGRIVEHNKVYGKVVNQIRCIGQALIDNAEVMAGRYKYQTGDLDINVSINPQEAPVISIGQELLPESWVERKAEV